MTESDDSKSRRDLITKLVPYMALSALRVGVFDSPLSLLTNAATKYNEDVEKTKEKVNDLLPLLPGVEKLRMEVIGRGAVSLVLHRRDIKSCAEQYLRRAFILDGALGAPGGEPLATGEDAEFDYVLRLPSKSVYMKVVTTLTNEEASRLRQVAERLNPAEIWVFADTGEMVDARMGPVFVSEGKTLRGRLRSMTTAGMLYELFGRKFTVALEPTDNDSARLMLRIAG